MPTYASGLSGQVGAVAESTYGTPVTVTHFYEFLSETLTFVPTWLDGLGLKSGQAYKRASRTVQSRFDVTGDVEQGPPSPLHGDLMQAVRSTTNEIWPGVPAVPMMVMGATDGLYLRRAGIPTYGVQGIFFDRNDIRFHGRDERVKIDSFYEGQAFLYELVKRLAQGD